MCSSVRFSVPLSVTVHAFARAFYQHVKLKFGIHLSVDRWIEVAYPRRKSSHATAIRVRHVLVSRAVLRAQSAGGKPDLRLAALPPQLRHHSLRLLRRTRLWRPASGSRLK